MHTFIQKWGNSLALRIPAFVSKELAFEEGAPVEITIQDKRLVIKPHTLELDELLEGITEANRHHEAFQEADSIVGNEIW